ncbi:MAG TPA: long-chain fatty acid--CoA ligase [Streptosporangiaceae bacterium]|nr:long-chain fatty acid--CoA ligase [Streptosporangiaceae bacterium]
MDFNLAVMLAESARRVPAKPAVILGDRHLSYAELDALSDRVAANLTAAGLAPGDRVGLQLPNIPQFVIAYFGILKAGGVVVPMNVLLKAPEIEFQLRDSEARTLITFAGFFGEAAKAAGTTGVSLLYVVGEVAGAGAAGAAPFESLLAGEQPGRQLTAVSPADPAVIIYTSGTTGTPKGAVLSHFTLYMNADISGRLFEFAETDVVVVALPLFHIFGLSSIMNICVLLGGTMTLVPRFEPAAVLEVIQRDKVTIFEGVPTMYIALLNAPGLDEYDLSSLRVAVSGGAPIPAEVIDSFERRFGVVILEGYGLSETSSTTTFNISAEQRKVYSVGKPIWGVSVQIWDRDGRPLPAGSEHVGEIVVRGPNVMNGYHGNPEATAEAFAGGWFHTGDLGYFDSDGFLFIVDRIKDLIIRGGYNVYPREVEEVIYTHPAVAEAAVIGIPDDLHGEEVHAIVVTMPGHSVSAEEISDFVKARVAAYKYPRTIEFRDSLPKGATGKILKKELRPA